MARYFEEIDRWWADSNETGLALIGQLYPYY